MREGEKEGEEREERVEREMGELKEKCVWMVMGRGSQRGRRGVLKAEWPYPPEP
jgi:hypothetical protein